MKTLKTIILISIVFALCASIYAANPSPPVWAQTFSQDFVIGDTKTKLFTSGKMFYDIKNNRQRIDYLNSQYNALCFDIYKDSNASCSQVNLNDSLYVFLPGQGKCCKCCTAAQGCTIEPRDWLSKYNYSGQATLSGQTFYKWVNQQINQNYYDTEDSLRIPRRVESGTTGVDFIMNTYSRNPIDNSVFQLPSSCNANCPKPSICGTNQ